MLVAEQLDVINIGELVPRVVLVEHPFAPVLLSCSELWDQFQGCWLIEFVRDSLVPEGVAVFLKPSFLGVLGLVEVELRTAINPAKRGIDLSLDCCALSCVLQAIIKACLCTAWPLKFTEPAHSGWLGLKLRHRAARRVVVKERKIVCLGRGRKPTLLLVEASIFDLHIC